ncbi:MAG: TIM barrel protein [Thermoplasmata archaeon]|nr:TIM barrel protein [Thermoplasmata archaeon]
MRHLLSHSVYQDLSPFGSDPQATLSSVGCDGLELLTGYSEPDPCYRGIAETVHLPYAPDWLAAWEDRPLDMPEENSLYHMYGRCREDVVRNVTLAIDSAASLSPAYGVFHACNTDTTEVFHRRYSRSDAHVVDALCEMMNTVVSAMPGGEPPYRILFENLWWPGLRLVDESGFRILERRLEFSDWGICLDTGHMMGCFPIMSEREGIDTLLDVFRGYSRDLIDRIDAIHFHWSASGEYRATFEERELDKPVPEFIADANAHVVRIDGHRPFSDPKCAEIVEELSPRYVVHEMPGTEVGVLEDFSKQRALLP